MSDKKSSATGKPKTMMDVAFLELVQDIMIEHKVPSERAMSLEISPNPNFISRIKTGVQSAPPDAWGTLFRKFNLRSVTLTDRDTSATNNVSRAINVIGSTVGTVTQNYTSISECEKDLKSANEKIAMLTSQLQDKERTIQILLNQPTKP